jgi:hypothetical protein
MQSKIFCVIGPDRVGKSTLINEMVHNLETEYGVANLHFSGPLRGDLTPIDQYLVPLQSYYPYNNVDFFILDRGPQEVLFYEKSRRAANIPGYYYHVMEDVMLKLGQPFVVLVEQSWDAVKPRHEEELAGPNPGEPFTLEERRREHESYYDFMYQLQKQSRIHWITVDKAAYEQNPEWELSKDIIYTYGFNYRNEDSISYLPPSQR